MNSYDLSRNWFDWCFENPEKISPNHTAMYFFIIEHCNRLGWKAKFGLPATMVKDAIGIKSYNTYKKTFDDLVEWKFITLIQESKNQYSSNIIALSNFNKAHSKALDKALVKHSTKQSESTGESISSIDKPLTIKPTTKNNIDDRKLKFADTLKPFVDVYGRDLINDFYKYWTEPNKSGTKFKQESQTTWSLELRLERWAKNDRNFKPQTNGTGTAKSGFHRETMDERMDKVRRESAAKRAERNGSQESANFEDVGFTDVIE